ncbi:VIT family protein [Curtobacterium sp. ISL-83]|uniref:VIT1/CCC1 transporter family protein n=1 Tax=Curtobacterium sp. ISL-83 TaxID=2819145 RepID=UPI001BE5890A|nr:VIT family protein [Curtobacterium sp. ISL-83]MBT2503179.1 VIT family protein [Curtobacterium sp. ISL-83]
MTTVERHADEPHEGVRSGRLNWLRAGVLGANDGIVSVAAVVVGVAGATTATGPLLTAGTAALAGGAISMALGEYVSVSSQRDSERALIELERSELRDDPEGEFEELVELWQAKGLQESTARQVARELTDRDVLAAHLDVELGIDEQEVTNPWHAALASAVSFLVGGALPFLAILLAPNAVRVLVTVVVVLLALGITGALGARLGHARVLRATIRVLIGGAAALAITYGLGALLGTTGI